MTPRTKSMLLIALDILEKSFKREMKTKRDAGRTIQAQQIVSELDDLHEARRDVAALPVNPATPDNHVDLPLSPSTVKNK